MTTAAPQADLARTARISWAVATVLVMETVLLGISATPGVALWTWVYDWPAPAWARVLILAMAFVPSYVLFAACLMVTSAVAARLFGWRTLPDLNLPLAGFSWPVLDWGRYLITIHVVRLFAGGIFRSTPVWTWYLRLNGARIGPGGWVNSLVLMDHNLLDFDRDVVIGSDAHISGHVVERGMLRTAPVRLGRGVTVGVGSVVGIGVVCGERTQIGALSVVPKFTTLEAGVTYAGAPVRRLD